MATTSGDNINVPSITPPQLSEEQLTGGIAGGQGLGAHSVIVTMCYEI